MSRSLQQRRRKEIPLCMMDALNWWKASGRTAVVYPFAGTISLNGFAAVPYAEAHAKIDAVMQAVKP